MALDPATQKKRIKAAAALAMGKVSGLPVAWFFEPDLSKLFADPDAPSLRRDVDRLVHRLEGLEAALV